LLLYLPAVATWGVVDQGVVTRRYYGIECGLILPYMYDGAVIKFTEEERKKGRKRKEERKEERKKGRNTYIPK